MDHPRRARCLFAVVWTVTSLALTPICAHGAAGAGSRSINAPAPEPASCLRLDTLLEADLSSLATAASEVITPTVTVTAPPPSSPAVESAAATSTITPTNTATPTATPTQTSTATCAATPTETATSTATTTPTATPTATATPTPSPGPTVKLLPDLYIIAIHYSPDPPIINQPFTVIVKVGNHGTAATIQTSWVALYKDNTTTVYKEMPMYPIAAGATRDIPFTVIFQSPEQPGFHSLFAEADSTNVIDEVSTFDNTGFVYVYISPPPTVTPSPSITLTPSVTPSPTSTPTLTFSSTPIPLSTWTQFPTVTPQPTRTLTSTGGPSPSPAPVTSTPTARVSPTGTLLPPTITPLAGLTATPATGTPVVGVTPTSTPTRAPARPPLSTAAKIESVVIGIFVGLLLVAGALLALGPRLAAGGKGAAGLADALEERFRRTGGRLRTARSALMWRAQQLYRRIRRRGPDE